MNPNIKSKHPVLTSAERECRAKRHAMLGKLFISAQEHGISQDDLRDYIAPELIGKRLSAANEREIGLVLEHICGPRVRRPSSRVPQKYPSSIQGLKDEICDLARARFGESLPAPGGNECSGASAGWELPLNNFCRRFGIERWQWLDVNHGKAVKGALLRLANDDCRSAIENNKSQIENPQSDNEVPF